EQSIVQTSGELYSLRVLGKKCPSISRLPSSLLILHGKAVFPKWKFVLKLQFLEDILASDQRLIVFREHWLLPFSGFRKRKIQVGDSARLDAHRGQHRERFGNIGAGTHSNKGDLIQFWVASA